MPVWKDLYTKYREMLKITPRIKDDYARIMTEAVKSGVNADAAVKDALTAFIRPYAFSVYKSAQSYRWATIIPAMFVQWLSEQKNKKISLSDLNEIDFKDGIFFAEEYSEKPSVQAQVASYLRKFGTFLLIDSATRKVIRSSPFIGLKVDMPESGRVIVYNDAKLEDFYNVILFGTEKYYTLFFRAMLQTGMRPYHLYFLTCGDIEYDNPQKDALGRTFYPVFARSMVDREKRKIKEAVFKKLPPDVIYISESLKNDIVAWCEEKRLAGSGYVFKDFVNLRQYDSTARRRRLNPTIRARLKSKDTKYIFYGLRHTWTSVMWAITNNIGDLIDLGGWKGGKIPLTTYRASMKSCEALNIAKKWEIYLPPDRRDEILDLQTRCELGEEKTGAPAISVQEFEAMKKMVDVLSKRVEELTKQRPR